MPLVTAIGPRIIRRQSQTKDFGKGKKGLSVDKKVILTPSRRGGQGRRRVGDNFQHVIAPHGPRKVKNATPTVGVMHFLSVGQNHALARGNGPDQRDIVFFATASRACFSIGESCLIGKAKAPARNNRIQKVRWKIGFASTAIEPFKERDNLEDALDSPFERYESTVLDRETIATRLPLLSLSPCS